MTTECKHSWKPLAAVVACEDCGILRMVDSRRPVSPLRGSRSVADRIAVVLAEHGPKTATELAAMMGMIKSRTNVSEIIGRDPRFVRLRRVGKHVPYDLAH